MNVDFVDIIIYFVVFIVGFGFAMMLLGEIAKVLFKEFANRFDEQVDLYKKRTDEALRTHLKNVTSTLNFKDEILLNFEIINQETFTLQKQLKTFSELCENRQELESEIIKLKNILKRKEKHP